MFAFVVSSRPTTEASTNVATTSKTAEAKPFPLPAGHLLSFSEDSIETITVTDATGTRVFEVENARSPVLSPDGKKLAFVRPESFLTSQGMQHQSDIWVVELGGAPLQLTKSSDNEYAPSWSPDGKRIVFATQREGNFGNGLGLLEVIDSDGAHRHAITKDDGPTEPAWSPDGKQIAFVLHGICLMNADGKNRHRLTNDYSDAEPAWSPDGKWIAYSSGEDESVTTRDGRDGPIDHSTDDIYLLSANGRNGSGKRITDGKFDYQAPCWSPDGAWIVCESDKDGVPLPEPSYEESDSRGPYNLYVMKRDGSSFQRITNKDSSRQHASWR